MEIDYIAIGTRIRKFRKNKNYTQAYLAEAASVEPSNISHIERGATKVSLPTLIKIANALNISMDELLCESIKKSSHVSIKELNELLSDCSAEEIKAVVEIVKTTKSILRNQQTEAQR